MVRSDVLKTTIGLRGQVGKYESGGGGRLRSACLKLQLERVGMFFMPDACSYVVTAYNHRTLA